MECSSVPELGKDRRLRRGRECSVRFKISAVIIEMLLVETRNIGITPHQTRDGLDENGL